MTEREFIIARMSRSELAALAARPLDANVAKLVDRAMIKLDSGKREELLYSTRRVRYTSMPNAMCPGTARHLPERGRPRATPDHDGGSR